jgi:cytochrome c-type biogenesis protein CcmH
MHPALRITQSNFMKRLATSITLLIALLLASIAFAQDTTPLPANATNQSGNRQAGSPSDDQVNAIAKQLYCPVCENIPLDVCGTQACAQWRDLIREKLSQGWSEAQIKQYFVDQYGDRVLATPPARGLNWLVYLVPPVAIAAGVFILYRALKAWKQPAPQAASTPPAPEQTDEYVMRLEEELKKR